jgi:hypothetical protein
MYAIFFFSHCLPLSSVRDGFLEHFAFSLRTGPHFLFGVFNTLSAPIRASPSTTLERVNTAFGHIVSAAFWSNAKSSAVIFTVTDVVLFMSHRRRCIQHRQEI